MNAWFPSHFPFLFKKSSSVRVSTNSPIESASPGYSVSPCHSHDLYYLRLIFPRLLLAPLSCVLACIKKTTRSAPATTYSALAYSLTSLSPARLFSRRRCTTAYSQYLHTPAVHTSSIIHGLQSVCTIGPRDWINNNNNENYLNDNQSISHQSINQPVHQPVHQAIYQRIHELHYTTLHHKFTAKVIITSSQSKHEILDTQIGGRRPRFRLNNT